jgi:hypothetical protein
VVALNPSTSTSRVISFSWLEITSTPYWSAYVQVSSPPGWLVTVQDVWSGATWGRYYSQDESIDLPAFAHDASMVQVWLVPPPVIEQAPTPYQWLTWPVVVISIISVSVVIVTVGVLIFLPEVLQRLRQQHDQAHATINADADTDTDEHGSGSDVEQAERGALVINNNEDW